MVDAFPWDTAPRYLLRDRDQIYGGYFDRRVAGLEIEQVLTAPRFTVAKPVRRKAHRIDSSWVSRSHDYPGRAAPEANPTRIR